MKILISVEIYYPHTVGSAYATYHLVNGLVSRGHKVFVICSGDSLTTKKTIENGAEVFRISSVPMLLHKKFRISPLAHHIVGSILDEIKPDIIHVQDHMLIGSSVIEAALKRGVPLVGTNHFHPDNLLHYLNAPKSIENKIRKAAWKHFNAIFEHLDAITTPSQIAKKVMQVNGTKKHISVVSNGIDLKRFKPLTEEETSVVKNKFNLSNSSKIILFVGRIEKEKNIDVLIKTMKNVAKEAQSLLLIAGSGSQEEKLKELAADLGLENFVRFIGRVSDEDLVKLYNLADIFATASTVELQGLVVMEAMASGCPIVSSDSMALPELINDGINGFVFPSGNHEIAGKKIIKILKNEHLAKRMGKKSIELIRKHDFEKTLDQYEVIYANTITHHYKPSINRALFIFSKIILNTPIIAFLLLFAIGIVAATAETYEHGTKIKSTYNKVKIQATQLIKDGD